jgi:hypothetical protein
MLEIRGPFQMRRHLMSYHQVSDFTELGAWMSTLPTRGAKKRVFLSFVSEDKERVQGLRLLAANPNYDLEFYDESVRAAIDSQDADYIKRVIREKLSRTSVTVCLISENTYRSAWVDWELQESSAKGNKIIAMALKDVQQAVLPKVIREKALTFQGWNPALLTRLIAEP